MAVELITEHHLFGVRSEPQGRIHCWGAYVLDSASGRGPAIPGANHASVFRRGGADLYAHNQPGGSQPATESPWPTVAGAPIANLEFMQFHPTTLYHPEADSFLISEAVRGHGGVLVDRYGHPFMDAYHDMGALAPRDIVARAIDNELKKSGAPCVYLDVTHMPAAGIQERFPGIHGRCLELNVDITRQPIPVVPAAHYMCGGVCDGRVGSARKSKGLYASGEVAHTGLHGANRLASNSLLEALVFSDRVHQHACLRLDPATVFPDVPDWREDDVFNTEEWVLLAHDRVEVQRLMWDYVGIVRSDFRLKRAARRIGVIAREVEEFYKRTRVTEALLELRNITTVAALAVRCALKRRESRGLHYNVDCPAGRLSDSGGYGPVGPRDLAVVRNRLADGHERLRSCYCPFI